MSSPLFSEKAFDSARSATYEGEMTVSGTVNKTIALFIMMILPAAFLWMKFGVQGGEGEAGLAYLLLLAEGENLKLSRAGGSYRRLV